MNAVNVRYRQHSIDLIGTENFTGMHLTFHFCFFLKEPADFIAVSICHICEMNCSLTFANSIWLYRISKAFFLFLGREGLESLSVSILGRFALSMHPHDHCHLER